MTRMNLKLIGFAGAKRAKALDEAERHLSTILDEVDRAGELANVKLAAEVARVPRSLLTRRLKARQ